MTQERINWHLDLPVCRTLRGLKEHLHWLFLLNLRELLALQYAYSVDETRYLVHHMWENIKENKKGFNAQ